MIDIREGNKSTRRNIGSFISGEMLVFCHNCLQSCSTQKHHEDGYKCKCLGSESTGAGKATRLLPEQKRQENFLPYVEKRLHSQRPFFTLSNQSLFMRVFITINFNLPCSACMCIMQNTFSAPHILSASLTVSSLIHSERFHAGSWDTPLLRCTLPLPSCLSLHAETQKAWENPLCVHTYATQKGGEVKIPWCNSQPVSPFCPPSQMILRLISSSSLSILQVLPFLLSGITS